MSRVESCFTTIRLLNISACVRSDVTAMWWKSTHHSFVTGSDHKEMDLSFFRVTAAVLNASLHGYNVRHVRVVCFLFFYLTFVSLKDQTENFPLFSPLMMKANIAFCRCRARNRFLTFSKQHVFRLKFKPFKPLSLPSVTSWRRSGTHVNFPDHTLTHRHKKLLQLLLVLSGIFRPALSVGDLTS